MTGPGARCAILASVPDLWSYPRRAHSSARAEGTAVVVDPTTFKSKGKNTPFAGKHLVGWPVLTIVAGEIVYKGRFDETNIMA